MVAVVTEFGRTARINGTEGTDHGTATVTFLAGGAFKRGRVIADWPGLKDAICTTGATESHYRPARRAQRPAQGPPAREREGARRRGIRR